MQNHFSVPDECVENVETDERLTLKHTSGGGSERDFVQERFIVAPFASPQVQPGRYC